MATPRERCDICHGLGWLLIHNTDRDVLEIQRCDTCCKCESDLEAGEAAATAIEGVIGVLRAAVAAAEAAS